ncbi:CaiB/BaiF CoA transferase family protein [Roseibium aggregatum]|uniref:Formyl-coenzyme A transferase n=1 Tax=Roseibium aggregatum TaxID=187304 RepID=A0A0M6YB46_9HYPH|nr:CaiB/BaiF CoA-transferase family protein [Roseibium aggregatum]CTQ46954.1 Formyl-coenzyme A transferase [Roseibium aggregatum]
MNSTSELPLAGITVLDMSQFLSGPYATLRLQDLGARVIKIERPGSGDLSRSLYLSDTEIGGDSTIFHAINRGKESLAVDLKKPEDIDRLKRLIAKADVLVQNFRPGVIERLGLDYETVRAINPGLVYGSISGYGEDGPWVARPGQDLLAQARSGLMWLSGNDGDGPVPMGLAVGDMFAGAALAQGLLAGLVRRGVTGKGSHVQTSLLEALVDFQFEVLTTYLNDGRRMPKRSGFRNAHAYLSAPYGVYEAKNGYIAVAMTPIPKLRDLMELEALEPYCGDPAVWFSERETIKKLIAGAIAERTVEDWMSVLEPADIWCAPVLDWDSLLESEGFNGLDLLQRVEREDNVSILTTRSPLRVNGARPKIARAAPRVGEHTAAIEKEFGL